MSEHSRPAESQPPDRELNLRAILITVVGLAVLLIAAAALMWPLARSLKGRAQAADPPLPVLPEALDQPLPPEPRLQVAPEDELRALQDIERQRLTTWEWIDEGAGVARVPVERAMEILAERGLPRPDAPVPADASGGTP